MSHSRRAPNKNLPFSLYLFFYMTIGTVLFGVFFIIIQYLTFYGEMRKRRMSVFEGIDFDHPSMAVDFWVSAFFEAFLSYLIVAEATRQGFVKHVKFPVPHVAFFRCWCCGIANQISPKERWWRQLLRACMWGLVWSAIWGSLTVVFIWWGLESDEHDPEWIARREKRPYTYDDATWIKGYHAMSVLFLWPFLMATSAYSCETKHPNDPYIHGRPQCLHCHDSESAGDSDDGIDIDAKAQQTF